MNIQKSIDLLKRTEQLALEYSPDGFHLAFSGGKSVSYEQYKTEMDAKNRAYAFILLCDLYDEFVA